jgi:hypothetical protein
MFDIYIHSNKKNTIPAKVGKYSFEKINNNNVNIVNIEEFDYLLKLDGKTFYRNNKLCQLNINSSQSFFLLRFIIPYYHKFILKSTTKWILIIDPDIFCIKKLDELKEYILKAEQNNKDIICYNKLSSFMLINTYNFYWEPNKLIENIFQKNEDFNNYMLLKKYSNNIQDIPEYFNHYDKLNNNTICLHTSRTHTQPWKTGIKYLKHDLHNIPYDKNDTNYLYFKKHNDNNIEYMFFKLFNEAYINNYINDDEINISVNIEGLRPDYTKFLNKKYLD